MLNGASGVVLAVFVHNCDAKDIVLADGQVELNVIGIVRHEFAANDDRILPVQVSRLGVHHYQVGAASGRCLQAISGDSGEGPDVGEDVIPVG